MDLDLWELSLKHNINILGSNISSGNDITLTTTEGDVNILSLINQEYSQVQSVSQGLLSGEVNITGHSSQTIHQSNITSNNNLTINSGNNINILASNIEAMNNGNIIANNNINITSLQETHHYWNYHQETSLDIGALALQLGVAVGVGAMTGGAGFALLGSGFGAGLTAGAVAGATAIGTSHLTSFASHSAGNVFAGFMSGDGTLHQTNTTQNINSNLSFGNTMLMSSNNNTNIIISSGDNTTYINKDKDCNILSISNNLDNLPSSLNILQANIQVNNTTINEGLDTTIQTTTTTTHTDIKPDYSAIATSGAVIGLGAGLGEVGFQYLSSQYLFLNNYPTPITNKPIMQYPVSFIISKPIELLFHPDIKNNLNLQDFKEQITSSILFN